MILYGYCIIVTINFKISDNDDVKLKIFNTDGREVATLLNEKLIQGKYEIKWDAGNFPDGIYFYRLETGSFAESGKLVLLR